MDREEQAKIIAEAYTWIFEGKEWYWEVRRCDKCNIELCNPNKGETGCLRVMLKNPPKEPYMFVGITVPFKYMDEVIEENKQKIKSRKKTENDNA